jgi:hypothetical protein
MQGIHTYVPETNHVSRVYSVAGIPRVLLMVHIALFIIIIIIIIIIISQQFSCSQNRRVSLPKHFSFTVLPKTV